MRRFTVGTRGSALALWQTRHVTSRLAAREITERVITTQGDTNLSDKLVGKLEKGFFTQELEAALFAKEIDWAVHSLKDLPTRMPQGLALGAVLERAPAADLLLLRADAVDLDRELPVKRGMRIGTCSLRREAMLQHFAPGTVNAPLRGNVPTRVTKLLEGQYDGIVLAEAGVMRLALLDGLQPGGAASREGLAVFRLNPARWQCAPGQGAVAVQCREDDAEVMGVLSSLNDAPTARATGLERDFLRTLEGGCTTPFGCFVDGQRASLGLATERGWSRRTVDIPASPDAKWIDSILATLPDHQEDSHDWLTRRL